jgi:hypothetical protein
MKAAFLGILSLLLAFTTAGQISYGGAPYGTRSELKQVARPAPIKLPTVDVSALLAEDEINLTNGRKGPYRFGFNHSVDLTTVNSGTWYTYPNGDRLWRLRVLSPGAFAINMEFHEYVVPDGGKVFIYNDAGDYLGAYTAESNGGRPIMGVQPITGDDVTIEYFEPASVAGQGNLKIGQITHAYRDPFGRTKGFDDSGACNNNVICPEGNDWRDQVASVARIIVNGNDHCTGQLINNCAEDGHPFFLTADHCMTSNPNTWVFLFNWESPTCSPTTNAPDNQTISGATTLTQSAATDVALLELNTTVPSSFNARYTGWDRSSVPSAQSVAIHHPSGDVKKISFDLDPVVPSTWSGAQVWRVNNWEDGTTEGGSSGSGLWNQNGHLVGQLFGGGANCNNQLDDNYGRFDLSWPVLSPFLGSCGPTLDIYPAPVLVDYDIRVTGIDSILPQVCGISEVHPFVRVRNSGGVTVTSFDLEFKVDNGPSNAINWTGSLATGQEVSVELPAQTLSNGLHVLDVEALDPNGMVDQAPWNNQGSGGFAVQNPGQNIDVVLTLDDYGSETTWELKDANGTVVGSGGPYGNGLDGTVIRDRVCLPDGCYDLTMFDQIGDGMCCDFGNGDFGVEDEYGAVIVDGDGQFGTSVTENFCLTNTGLLEWNMAMDLSLFPNPTEGAIRFTIPDQLKGSVSVQIADALGRTVFEKRASSDTKTMEVQLTDLRNGSYILVLSDGLQQAQGRFVLAR